MLTCWANTQIWTWSKNCSSRYSVACSKNKCRERYVQSSKALPVLRSHAFTYSQNSNFWPRAVPPHNKWLLSYYESVDFALFVMPEHIWPDNDDELISVTSDKPLVDVPEQSFLPGTRILGSWLYMGNAFLLHWEGILSYQALRVTHKIHASECSLRRYKSLKYQRNIPPFKEPVYSVTCSQMLATYIQSTSSNHFFKIRFLFQPLTLAKVPLVGCFWSETFCEFHVTYICNTRPATLIHLTWII